MKLHLDNSARFRITSYSPAGIAVNETTYPGSLIIQADTAPQPWAALTVDDISRQSLQTYLDLKPEIMLIGTGARQQFPAVDQLAFLYASELGFEIMDTAAACRTFNILIGEERRVIAAVLAPT
ncbi:MAG: hypothetical protein GKR94_13850 [Gammaproteobacteria bacterium]|nr:hypothetical protein [Gammaproteobacteria bacterium]